MAVSKTLKIQYAACNIYTPVATYEAFLLDLLKFSEVCNELAETIFHNTI